MKWPPTKGVQLNLSSTKDFPRKIVNGYDGPSTHSIPVFKPPPPPNDHLNPHSPTRLWSFRHVDLEARSEMEYYFARGNHSNNTNNDNRETEKKKRTEPCYYPFYGPGHFV